VSALDSYQFKAEIATVLEEAVLINWTAAFTFVYPIKCVKRELIQNALPVFRYVHVCCLMNDTGLGYVLTLCLIEARDMSHQPSFKIQRHIRWSCGH